MRELMDRTMDFALTEHEFTHGFWSRNKITQTIAVCWRYFLFIFYLTLCVPVLTYERFMPFVRHLTKIWKGTAVPQKEKTDER